MKRRTAVATAVAEEADLAREPANPFAGSSLVPMLIAGIVLVLVGMIAAATLS